MVLPLLQVGEDRARFGNWKMLNKTTCEIADKRKKWRRWESVPTTQVSTERKSFFPQVQSQQSLFEFVKLLIHFIIAYVVCEISSDV